jgi:outer membrane protein OmpA-like peptidoglycan-associated protein
MKYILTILIVLSLFTHSLLAQNEHTGLSVGLGYGAMMGSNTELSSNLRFQGRAFARYGFIEQFQVELGGGIGRISGDDFSTLVFPFDARLVFSPIYMENWHPFAYAGMGAMRYIVDVVPNSGLTNRTTSGWTSIIPFGIGFSYALTDQVAFEGSGGYTLTGTDNLDVTTTNSKKDNFWGFLFGLTLTFESGSADHDKDGLTNDQEKQLGTDPKNPDTDGDGLTDGEEVNKYNTDPKKADSDGDGLSDYDEVKKYSTNPNKADSDGDGLSDADEILKYKTDPNKADTDGDGLSDGDEVLKYKTDPLKADTDGDGLSDGDEVMKYKTDPLVADTDKGTVPDGVEVKRGTNPLDPTDDLPKKDTIQLEVGKNIVLEGIMFKSASAEISPESEPILEKVYNTLSGNPVIEVEIQGHTDNVGSHSSNLKLSLARAEAVKTYLVNKGIDAKRMTTKGFGPDKPIVPNTTDEGKQKNRRIEFIRMK